MNFRWLFNWSLFVAGVLMSLCCVVFGLFVHPEFTQSELFLEIYPAYLSSAVLVILGAYRVGQMRFEQDRATEFVRFATDLIEFEDGLEQLDFNNIIEVLRDVDSDISEWLQLAEYQRASSRDAGVISSLGEKVVDEIIRGKLVRSECYEDSEHPCLLVWSANVHDQLNAVIASHDPLCATDAAIQRSRDIQYRIREITSAVVRVHNQMASVIHRPE